MTKGQMGEILEKGAEIIRKDKRMQELEDLVKIYRDSLKYWEKRAKVAEHKLEATL